MNSTQIIEMMTDIEAEAIAKGRTWHPNDDEIIRMLMRVYFQTVEIDAEEIKWLFTNYLQKGIIDFPTAMKMARQRRQQEQSEIVIIRR